MFGFLKMNITLKQKSGNIDQQQWNYTGKKCGIASKVKHVTQIVTLHGVLRAFFFKSEQNRELENHHGSFSATKYAMFSNVIEWITCVYYIWLIGIESKFKVVNNWYGLRTKITK